MNWGLFFPPFFPLHFFKGWGKKGGKGRPEVVGERLGERLQGQNRELLSVGCPKMRETKRKQTVYE